MSKLLNDVTTNAISLEEALQRLLVIANKTDNTELAEWCLKEIKGYKNFDDLPDYRKCKSRGFRYSGINGRMQITNQPLLSGYLSEETIAKIEEVGLFENMEDVSKKKESPEPLYRDISSLSNEVYRNTYNSYLEMGVQCTSIAQIIPSEYYTNIYMSVKTRIINLICSYEKMGVDLDSLDVDSKEKIINQNSQIYRQIIVEGSVYYPSNEKEKKAFWRIFVPLLVGILSATISGILVYIITRSIS